MNNNSDEFHITWWLAEFTNPATEQSFQSHVQHLISRQLQTGLIVWGVLLLIFAVPDYVVLGLSRPFFYLLGFRIIVDVALIILVFSITPQSDYFRISTSVAGIAVAGFSGFMLFFIYRPEITIWVIVVMMFQLIGLLIFIPIRFKLSFAAAVYGALITLLTRWALGSTSANLIGLFFLLLLPIAVGAATAIRLGVLQRREFALLKKTEKINRDLEGEIERRLKLEAALKELAATDPLTGLLNRREYEMLFQHELERAKRMVSPLSVCIIDLDHFKQVNDRHGHAAGDEVLRRAADIFRKNIRAVDILGRFGGEEFIILLPETRVDQAAVLCNRLIQKLSSTDIETEPSLIRITATIGITQLKDGDGDINTVIRRADAALYKGKESGRNRVEIQMD